MNYVLCHLLVKCKHPNFVPTPLHIIHYNITLQHEALTQGGEDHDKDALRAVHLEVLDGNSITTGLVQVGPRAPVTSLLRDLFCPSILVYSQFSLIILEDTLHDVSL